MTRPVILTCAVTGAQTTRQQNPNLPVTPVEIADACLQAADAGAAIVHIHVRDPASGSPSMDVELYADVVARLRKAMPGLVVNLTAGPGGRFQPSDHDPLVPGPKTNFVAPGRRVEHVVAIRPDIATLDLNTMVSGREVVINTPDTLRTMAAAMRSAGVRPELELFDSGDIRLAKDLIADGTIEASPLCSIVMGVNYGFGCSIETLLYARSQLPPGAEWTAFGIGKDAFPMLAAALVAGGNVRIGMEDAVYLSRGVLARSNAEMVRKARRIVEDLGGEIATCEQVRARLCLPVRG